MVPHRKLTAGEWVFVALIQFVVTAFLLLVASWAHGQGWEYPVGDSGYVHPGTGHRDDGTVVCRLKFRSNRREPEGSGWRTDFPRAEENFGIRLGEITPTRVPETPWVVSVGSRELFQCPFVLASDVGTMAISDLEADNLRWYVQKGGVIWADDFWGSESWSQWLAVIAQIMTPGWKVQTPTFDHPIYGMHYQIRKTLQVSNLDHWRGNAQSVSERGEDSPETPLRVVVDEDGHVVIVMTHNSDIEDTWEREGDDMDYFLQFAPEGYALGVNVALYALTH